MYQNNSNTEKNTLDIIALLKSKPIDIKLWSPVIGKCTMEEITSSIGTYYHATFGDNFLKFYKSVKIGGKLVRAEFSIGKDGRPIGSDGTAEVLLFPSAEMRDWNKFAWKQGDILATDCNTFCVFFGWENETYTRFHAKWVGRFDDGHVYKDEDILSTYDWVTEDDTNKANKYIIKVETSLGGIINRKTFDIDIPSARFNDGDVVVFDGTDTYAKNVFILKKMQGVGKGFVNCYASATQSCCQIGIHAIRIYNRKIRLATEFEREQLNFSLAKEGKAWCPSKKSFMDIPKVLDFNYHDKILIKIANKHSEWRLYEFEYQNNNMLITSDGQCFIKNDIVYCNYTDKTEHLLGTTDKYNGE